MAHRDFSMCRLLSVSMSRYRRTNEKNHCRRLSRVSTIIAATSSTTLSKTRTEVLTSISIPHLSRRFTGFITPIEIAPFHSSDPTPSSRSDLWYVPTVTLRTYLHYERSYPIKCFFFISGVACRQKCQFSHADCREKSRRFHKSAVRNHGDFTKSP